MRATGSSGMAHTRCDPVNSAVEVVTAVVIEVVIEVVVEEKGVDNANMGCTPGVTLVARWPVAMALAPEPTSRPAPVPVLGPGPAPTIAFWR